MKSKIKSVADAVKILDLMKEEYDKNVMEIAQKVFDEHLKEKCIKHNMSFFTGNGSFYFEDNSSGKSYELDEIPKCLRLGKHTKELLNMYMTDYGFRFDSLGTMMETFRNYE